MATNFETDYNYDTNEILDAEKDLLEAVNNNKRYNKLFELASWNAAKWAKVGKYIDKYEYQHLTTSIEEWGIHKSYDLMRDEDWHMYIKRAYLLKDWDPRAESYKGDKEFILLKTEKEASKYLKIFESRIK